MYMSFTTKFSLLTLSLFLLINVYGQEPIYNFAFDADLEGWTTAGISSLNPDSAANAVWVWASDGTASSGAYASNRQIDSKSGPGAALFDSDGLDNGGVQDAFGQGPAPAPQRGELVSPSLDFSGNANVYLVFNQFYRYFANDASGADIVRTGPASIVEVSDGAGNTQTYLINEDANPNDATDNDDIQIIDISSVAANQGNVTVKFIWEGDYYYWLIDDIQFYEEIGYDIDIVNFTVPNNFETPDFAIENDTFDLEVSITNLGDKDIFDSIEFIGRILDPNLELIWADTGYFDTLMVDSTVIWDFDRDYVPSKLDQTDAESFYRVVYSARVKGDTMGEVVNPNNNVDLNGFQVRDLSFRKVPLGGGLGINGTAVGFDEEFAWANYFELSELVPENLKVSKIFFEAFTLDESIAGKSIIAYVVELPEEVTKITNGVHLNGGVGLNNFDFSQDLDALTAAGMVTGIGTYAFNQDDEDNNGGPYFVDVVDFETAEGDVILKPGRKYLIAIKYPEASKSIFQMINQDFQVFSLSSIAYYQSQGAWLLAGGPNTASIGMDLEFTTVPVDDVPLPENSVKIFPNPATDYIQIDIEFEKSIDAAIFLADAQGRIIKTDILPNVLKETRKISLNDLTSGSYVVRVSTKEGTKTEQIIVVK